MFSVIFKLNNELFTLTGNGEVFDRTGNLIFYREHFHAWFPIGMDDKQLEALDEIQENDFQDVFDELYMLTQTRGKVYTSRDRKIIINGQDFVMGEGNLATQSINLYSFRKSGDSPIQFRYTRKGWKLDYGSATFDLPKHINYAQGHQYNQRLTNEAFIKAKMKVSNQAQMFIVNVLSYPTQVYEALERNRFLQDQSYLRHQDRVTFHRQHDTYTMFANGIVFDNDKGQHKLFAFPIAGKYHGYDRNGVAVPIKSKIDKLFREVYDECFAG